MLWYCTKCGEGFHYKSNKSKHKTACPNPNGPDKYQGRAPYNKALEATFKKRQAIPVQIPQPEDEGEWADQGEVPLVEDQPQALEQPQAPEQPQPPEQPQEKSTYELETEKAVEAIGAGELLNIMARGVIPDAIVVEEEEKDVKPDVLDIEMQFD